MKLKRLVEKTAPKKTNVWKLMVKQFAADGIDPIEKVENDIEKIVHKILENFLFLSSSKPSMLVRGLQTLKYLYIEVAEEKKIMKKNSSDSDNSALTNHLKFYNMRQSRTLENCIKEGVTKRIHNSRKVIISKLKELNDANHDDQEASSDDAKKILQNIDQRKQSTCDATRYSEE